MRGSSFVPVILSAAKEPRQILRSAQDDEGGRGTHKGAGMGAGPRLAGRLAITGCGYGYAVRGIGGACPLLPYHSHESGVSRLCLPGPACRAADGSVIFTAGCGRAGVIRQSRCWAVPPYGKHSRTLCICIIQYEPSIKPSISGSKSFPSVKSADHAPPFSEEAAIMTGYHDALYIVIFLQLCVNAKS